MSNKIAKLIRKLPLCDFDCCKHLVAVLVLFIFLYPFHEYYKFGTEFTQWDLMLFSEVAVLIVALRIVVTLPDKFKQTLQRLKDRGVLNLNNDERDSLLEQLRVQGELVARVMGIVAFFAIALAFTFVLINKFVAERALLGVAMSFVAYIAGGYLGRLLNYSLLGRLLIKNKISINVDPCHVDNVGGLKPVGDYYYFQAKIVAIPALVLAVWWFMFPFWPRNYTYWEESYLWIMMFSVGLFIASYIIPFWSFHRLMVQSKYKWNAVSDRLSQEITSLRKALDESDNTDEKKTLLALIEEKTKRYWKIENMSTWPVDIKTQKQFKLNNFILFIPLAGDIAKRSVDIDHLTKFINGLLGSGS